MTTSKLRKSARGRDCQIRIPGICNFKPETTVLCHRNGAGMALKSPDIHAAFACSSCHDVIDGRRSTDFPKPIVAIMFCEGIFRTQAIWLKEGLISVK